MKETFEQYTGRIRGYVKGRDPRRVLRSTPARLQERLSGVPGRRLLRPPAKGKWSVAQILAHLAEMEMLWGYRIRTMLVEDGVRIIGMDQDAWAKAGRYQKANPKRSLAAFRAGREANLELARRLPKSALSRYGRHSQFGRLTISDIFTFLAGHDVNHSVQIEAILGRRDL